jgi:hypothetical protein
MAIAADDFTMRRAGSNFVRGVHLVRRRAGLGLAEFHDYWSRAHGPLVAELAADLGFVSYSHAYRIDGPMNNAALVGPRRHAEPPYDGVAEFWWEDEQSVTATLFSPAGRHAHAAIVQSEGKILDRARSPLWLAVSHPQVLPPEGVQLVSTPQSSIAKLHFPIRQHSSLTLEEAQRYWLTRHGPLVRAMSKGLGIRRYEQVHRFPSLAEDELRRMRRVEVEAYAGHAESWIDLDTRESSPDFAELRTRAVEDEALFIDFRRSTLWLSREQVFMPRP